MLSATTPYLVPVSQYRQLEASMKASRRLPLDAHLYVLRTVSDWSAAKASYACPRTTRLERGKSSYPVVGSKYAPGVFYRRLKRIHKKIPKEIISENTSADHLAIKISDPKNYKKQEDIEEDIEEDIPEEFEAGNPEN
jgi:hypothetical protein